MIISHKYKFIFLHVPKVAGSSISVFLSQFLGDDDIMLDAWNDALAHGVPYNKRVFTEINNAYGLEKIQEALSLREKDGKILERPVLDYAFRKVIGKTLGTETVHATASHIRDFDRGAWKDYFKFAFVRNPFTHALSWFRWNEETWSLRQGSMAKRPQSALGATEFNHFLKNLKNRPKPTFEYDDRSFLIPGNAIYTSNGHISVDYMGRFETLQKDMEKISTLLELPISDFKLPHTKKNATKNLDHYYSEENKSLVKDIWATEFELFDYEYPEPKN